MKQRPLLMTSPLVSEVLDGKKTQTRRPVKGILNENPDHFSLTTNEIITMLDKYTFPHFEFEDAHGLILCVPSQYGVPGDGLWIKEGYYAWGWWHHTTTVDKPKSSFIDVTIKSGREYIYQTEDPPAELKRGFLAGSGWYKRNSLFMPKTASRVTLDILEIGVERLHDISEEDAKAEGVQPDRLLGYGKIGHKTYREGFFRKWYEIYDLASFKSNPWVWVIKFKKDA